jgi:hypothetical protein
MSIASNRTDFITLKIWRRTAPRLQVLAKKNNQNLSSYVESLVTQAEGFEDIIIDKKKIRHQESYDEGYSSGVVAAIAAFLDINSRNSSLVISMIQELKVNLKASVEWDLRIIRRHVPIITQMGRLAKDHRRFKKILQSEKI